MPNFREAYRSAKGRINPEGVAVTSFIATASIPSMLPIEIGLTTAIHEMARGDPNLVRLTAVVLSGAANAASVALEARALKKTEYSASPGGTALYIMTGKPEVSSALEHGLNYAQLTLINPINAIAIYNNDAQLFVDSLIATSLIIPLWNLPFNGLIVQGKMDSIVNRMRRGRKSIWGRIKNRGREKTANTKPAFSIAYSEELAPGQETQIPGQGKENDK